MTQTALHTETSNLVKALRTPNVRGKWGELQLKRVVEMAGMVEHCDFLTQVTESHDDGNIRPDLIVQLPNQRTIIVDAKAPLQAYLEAIESSDEVHRARHLKDHSRQLRKHLTQLGDKAYYEQFQHAPEFVVLFLPSESIFYVALEHDPSLIEYGVDRNVLLATPTTLIALLRAVALGFREEVVAEHAMRISELGKSLYDRLLTMVDHLQKLKRSLDTSCDAYNKVAGCFEGRVLVAARRFQEMGVSDTKAELETPAPIEKLTRSIELSYATETEQEIKI
jgi:DNA recombination protein RmuC